MNKHLRKFLVRSCGLDPKATDEEAQKHHDALHPDVQKAAKLYADAEQKDEDDEDDRKKTAATADAATCPATSRSEAEIAEPHRAAGHRHQ